MPLAYLFGSTIPLPVVSFSMSDVWQADRVSALSRPASCIVRSQFVELQRVRPLGSVASRHRLAGGRAAIEGRCCDERERIEWDWI